MAEARYQNVPLSPLSYPPLPQSIPHPGVVKVNCTAHRDQQLTHYCDTCGVLLCFSCLTSLSGQHQMCQIEALTADNTQLCERVKGKIASDLSDCRRNLSSVHQNLLTKQQRLLRKKEETASEIQRYFTDLRNKISIKLNERERELMEQLNSAVSVQHEAVKDYINQCENLNHSLQQNRTMVENLDQIYKMGRGNSIEHLKKLTEVSSQIDHQKNNSPSIDAARDFFLVIRFFIDTEIERTFLSANIACVEVVNSVDGDTSLSQSGSREQLDAVAPEVDSEMTDMPRTHTPFSESEEELEDINSGLFVQIHDVNNSSSSSRNDNSRSSSREQNLSASVTSMGGANRDLLEPADSESSDSSHSSIEIGEDEPPPPYPGLPATGTNPDTEDPPPPYPGPPNYSPPRQGARRSPRPPRRPPPVLPSALPPPTGSASQQQPRRQRSSTNGSFLFQNQEPSLVQTRGPMQKFSASEVNDQRSCGIVAMVKCKDNRLLIVDRWNKKLKYFSDTGVSYGGLIFREEPWDITSLPEDIFAVTVPTLSIIYKVKATDESVITTRRIDTPRMYACLAYHALNDVFVCGQVPQFGEPVVDIISASGGPVLLSFRVDRFGQHMFSYPRYVEVASDGTAVVCDWNMKALVLFNLNGAYLGRYKGSSDNPLNDPSGIFLSKSTGSIFVIDSKATSTSGAIHKLSLEGQCTARIIGQKYFRDARAILVVGHRIFTGSNKGIVNCFVRVRPSNSSNTGSNSNPTNLTAGLQGSAV